MLLHTLLMVFLERDKKKLLSKSKADYWNKLYQLLLLLKDPTLTRLPVNPLSVECEYRRKQLVQRVPCCTPFLPVSQEQYCKDAQSHVWETLENIQPTSNFVKFIVMTSPRLQVVLKSSRTFSFSRKSNRRFMIFRCWREQIWSSKRVGTIRN